MCYFLYGAVNQGADTSKCVFDTGDFEYRFNSGDSESVNSCVKKCGDEYRITDAYCDCENPVGTGETGNKLLIQLADMIKLMKKEQTIKYVLISKNWAGEENEKEEDVHIDDINVLDFLAKVKDNCLYQIMLDFRY